MDASKLRLQDPPEEAHACDLVAAVYSTHFFITQRFDLSAKNVSDLIAAARAKKGALTYTTCSYVALAEPSVMPVSISG